MRDTQIGIRRFIFFGMWRLSGIVTLVVVAFFFCRDYLEFRNQVAEMREHHLEHQKSIIRSEVEQVASFIEYNWRRTEQQLREDVKARTEEAHGVATALYDRYRGRMPEKDLFELVRETLRGMRFNGGRGYYFATRMDGVELLFADHPELEGKQLIDMRDTRGAYVIRDMIDLVRREGEGHYRYTWTKPDSVGRDYPKIAYLKHFEPFDGFIGTGEYLDDVERDIQQHTLNRIRDIRFGKDGYIFVVSYDGVTLMNGVQPELIGLNIWEMSDPYGVKVIQEERRVADIPGGDFITYHWKKPSTGEISPKVSFVIGFPEWEWMFGAGVYADEVEAELTQIERVFQAHVRDKALATLALLALALFVFKVYSNRFAEQLGREVGRFEAFFSSMKTGGRPIEEDKLRISEFGYLAQAANAMLASQKRAALELSESERFVATLLANLSGMVYRCRHDEFWTMEFVSEGCRELTGYGSSDLIDNRVLAYRDVILEHHRERVNQAVAEAVRTGGAFRIVYKIRHKSGLERWVWEQGRGVHDEKGTLTHLEGFITDITELKQAEAEIRKFKAVADKANYGMGISELDGRLIYVNEYFARAHNKSVADCMGRHLSIFHHRDQYDQVNALLQILIERGSFQLREVPHWREGDGAFPMLMNGILVEGQDGEPSYLAVTAVDLTRQKAVEREKIRLEAELVQAQRMESIGRLAGGIAHDFNNLLTGIGGNIALALMDVKPDAPPYELLSEAARATDSATELTRQLLSFSRKQLIEPKVMKLHDVVENLGRMLKRLIGENIALKTALDATGRDRVRIDPGQAQQILVNLTLNARDAMPEGGELTVQTACVTLDAIQCERHPQLAPGDFVLLAVSDTGCGMSEEVKSHLFEPFFTTKEKGKGTGLGLATVFGAVTQNKGVIEVDSELGVGTTVKVYFPRVEAEAESVTRPARYTMPKGSETVALVEDEEIVRELAVKVLKRQGYAVHAFSSGEDALRALETLPDPVDLLITDVIMPGINGRVTAERACVLRPGLKVLFTSGYAENVIANHGVLESNIEFVAKPYTPQALARKVRDVLDSNPG